MKIVIVGGGKVGETLCIDLAAENHDIIIVDQNADTVERLIGIADITGIVGNGANLNVLREAGASDCDIFIAVTAMDEINIIASIIAHKLGAKSTLARVRNSEYFNDLGFVQESLGISLMINPELEAAKNIAQDIRFPSALDIESFAGGRVLMVGVRVAKDSSLVNMKLQQFRETFATALVCVVQRGQNVIIPEGSFVIEGNDLLHVIGSMNDLASIYKVAGCVTRKIRSVMIIGGNRITRYLLKIIDRGGMDICVIDNDKSITEALAGEFPRAKIIWGDGTNQAVLDAQHLKEYDCFVALTGIDEENLVASLYAAKCKVPKIITKVNRTPLLHIFEDLGLQNIVTPKRLVSDIITRFVRATKDSPESKVEAMYRIIDGRVEALEFEVLKNSFATGIPIKYLKLKSNVLIAYIFRDNKLIFASGNDVIRPGDHLIAVTTEHDIDELDDLLEDEARK